MILCAYPDIEATASSPLAQTLGSLVREEHFRRIQLSGLSRHDVGEFIEARAIYRERLAVWGLYDAVPPEIGGFPMLL